MARPISDEELQLKKRARRRLVGAIVLVTAIAVVLPMILDSEPQPVSQNVEIQIPSPDAGEFEPKSAAAEAQADKTAKAAPDSDTRPITALPEPASRITEPETPSAKEEVASAKPAAPPKSVGSPDAGAKNTAEKPSTSKESASTKSASTKSAATAARGAYVVQVAALSDAAKAKQLEKRMSGTGLRTYTEVVTTASGRVTRVRAGPYPSRDAAEKARAQLKRAGFDGQVMTK